MSIFQTGTVETKNKEVLMGIEVVDHYKKKAPTTKLFHDLTVCKILAAMPFSQWISSKDFIRILMLKETFEVEVEDTKTRGGDWERVD